MKPLRVAIFTAAALLLGAAGAGEEQQTKIEIKIADSEGDTHVSLNSDALGFDLSEMQVGETRSVVDSDGRSVLVTREEQGFKLNVDGKEIELPEVSGAHGAVFVTADSDGYGSDVDVQMHTASSVSAAIADAGIMIISDKKIDEATQEGIRSFLMSSGYDSDVKFINAERAHDDHSVKVIKKQVEVTR